MKKFRVRLLLFIYESTQKQYRHYFKKNKQCWKFNEAQLLAFQEGTLGKKLGEFYKKHGFSMISKMEDHDVHHLITDCGTQFEDEIAMQFLLLGNGKLNAHLLAAIILGAIILPEYYPLYRNAYHKGKNMRSFHKINFEPLLYENFETVKNFIKQKNTAVHY